MPLFSQLDHVTYIYFNDVKVLVSISKKKGNILLGIVSIQKSRIGPSLPLPAAENPDSENLPTGLRRTRWETAGKHKHKFKQPRTAPTNSIVITVNELSVYLVITALLVLYGIYI